MRVLVVDNDAAFQQELTSQLRDTGHTATGVLSAADATEALEHEEFDAMFTDLQLRRRSGMDLLTEVRARWPRLIVVMLASNATVETAVQALHLGALDYLRKPIRTDQVQRVLDLIGQQLALVRTGGKPLDPVEYAKALAKEGGYEVLLITPPPPPVVPEKVSLLPLDPEDPSQIRSAVDDFVFSREKAAVVLAAIEILFEHHREEEVAMLLEQLRHAVEGKGPLAIGYDPNKISATGALTIRAAIAAADVHATLESLSSPVRRLVLRRLADGPCSFSQAMEAAHLDDTSKIAFHLRKLTDSGLVTHLPRQRYRLTARGRGALEVLGSIDELDSGKGSGNRVFVSKSPRAPPA
jgi:CheY-like chemotaxis protein/DNA-binding transcriptional ArsR family regulator